MSVEQCIRCQGSMVEDDSTKYTSTQSKEWFCIICGHRRYEKETPNFRSKEPNEREQRGGRSWEKGQKRIKLTEEQKEDIVQLWKTGVRQSVLGRRFNVGGAVIRRVLNRYIKKEEGVKWDQLKWGSPSC